MHTIQITYCGIWHNSITGLVSLLLQDLKLHEALISCALSEISVTTAAVLEELRTSCKLNKQRANALVTEKNNALQGMLYKA